MCVWVGFHRVIRSLEGRRPPWLPWCLARAAVAGRGVFDVTGGCLSIFVGIGFLFGGGLECHVEGIFYILCGRIGRRWIISV